VRPGVNGTHRVVIRETEKWKSEEEAISQANHFCENERNNTRAAIVEEKTTYNGAMDENTRSTVKNASRAAMVVGGMIGAASHDPIPGVAVSGAGTAGHIMTNGKDYTTDMKFKCQ
jgi:hypothetical protein